MHIIVNSSLKSRPITNYGLFHFQGGGYKIICNVHVDGIKSFEMWEYVCHKVVLSVILSLKCTCGGVKDFI